jgi:hypothetical protein
LLYANSSKVHIKVVKSIICCIKDTINQDLFYPQSKA